MIFDCKELSEKNRVSYQTLTSVGNVCVVRAAATILPGQEVSDNYGHYFQVKPKVHFFSFKINALHSKYCKCVSTG